MAVRDDLEATLQDTWSLETLAVYGDHLLACGDPRGEVIALDLQPSPGDRTWWLRRRAALAAWLGDELAVRAGHLVQHGFIHELRDGNHPPELLDSPLGDVVRGYTTWGRVRVPAALTRLARRPRPWLVRLAIGHWGKSGADDMLGGALIAATPHLQELHLAGRRVFAAFPHPALRRMHAARRATVTVPEQVTIHTIETHARLSEATMKRLLAVIATTSDCNQLYRTHDAQFAEPLPALLVRLHVMGLVELDGPVVRLVEQEPFRSPPGENLEVGSFASSGHLEVIVDGEPALLIAPLSAHTRTIMARLYGRWSHGARVALERYFEILKRVIQVPARLEGVAVRELVAVLDTILELPAGAPHDGGVERDWIDLERLLMTLDSPGGCHGAAFRFRVS